MKHEPNIEMDAAICFVGLINKDIPRLKLVVKKRFGLGEVEYTDRSLWFQHQPMEYQANVTRYMIAQMISVTFNEIETEMEAEANETRKP